jgi:hypothetical protein
MCQIAQDVWFNYNVNKKQPNHTHQRQLVDVCSIWWICYITTCNNAHVHVQCSREFSLVSIERYDFYIHLHLVEISPSFPYNFYIQWNLCNPIPEFSNILRHLTTNYDPKVSRSAKSQKNLVDIFDNCNIRIQIWLVIYHLCDDIKELRNVLVYKYTYQHINFLLNVGTCCI